MVAQAVEIPSHVPRDRVIDIDVYNPPEKGERYFEAWKELQDRSRDIMWTTANGGHWVATRGKVIREIFDDYKHFSSQVIMLPRERGHIHLPPTTLDPPVHRPFRALLNKGLSPSAVRQIEQGVRKYAVELLEKIQPQGACEFVDDFARFLPLVVFLQLAGLPMGDRDKLEYWMKQVIRPDGSMTQDEAMGNFADYLRPIMDARSKNPGGDILSDVAAGTVVGRPITAEEAIAMGSTVLIGGLDTVVAFMSFVMNYLARSPAARKYILQHPDEISNIVEEFSRRFPVGTNVRYVAEDVEMDGVLMKKNDLMSMPQVFHSLDERVYERPLDVDFTRNSAGYVSFGQGVHRCPGAFLAKTEVIIVLQEWLPRIPDFELVPGTEVEVSTGTTSGIFNLPLQWSRSVA